MSSPVRMVVPTDAYPNSLTKHMLSRCEEVVPAPFLPSVRMDLSDAGQTQSHC